MGKHSGWGENRLDKVSNNVKIITRRNGTTSEFVHAISQINPHIHLQVIPDPYNNNMFPQFPKYVRWGSPRKSSIGIERGMVITLSVAQFSG